MNLDKKNIWKILGIIAFGIVLYFALNQFDSVMNFIRFFVGLLMPVIVGICIAFVANVPLRFFERKLFGLKALQGKKYIEKFKRPFSITLSFLLILGIILFVIFMVVPEFARTLAALTERIPEFFRQVQGKVNELLSEYPELASSVIALDLDWNNIGTKVLEFVQSGASSVLNSTVTVATSVFSAAFNLVIGFVFAIYFLYDKETLI